MGTRYVGRIVLALTAAIACACAARQPLAVLQRVDASHTTVAAATAPSAPSAAPTESAALPTTQPSADDVDPADTIPFLASDALEGRLIGTPGNDAAAQFIAAHFKASGLVPPPGMSDYYQPFDYTASTKAAPETRLQVGSKEYKLRDQFTPLAFSAEGKFDGPVVFAGYGVSAPQAGYDDYAGIDVKGKVVLAMRFEPMDEHGHSLIKPREPNKAGEADALGGWSPHATFGEKAKVAADHGAAAVLVVTPPGANEPDILMPFGAASSGGRSTIPILQVRQSVAADLLAAAGATDLKSQETAIDSAFKPQSAVLNGVTASGNVRIEQQVAHVRNVIGILPGAGPHADEYVVVGAHYDHLGRGQLGHQFGKVGGIFHGADDNASGTAAVMKLASVLAKKGPPARSIVFVAFTAEEEGLIGSRHFVDHPPVPMEKVVAMLNLDMVGRVKDEALFVGGAGTAKSFDEILQSADAGLPLQLKTMGRGGFGPSDHMSFALKHVPVLFLFSGLHADYHRQTDTADKVNYPGIADVVTLASRVVDAMTTMPREPYDPSADSGGMMNLGSAMGTDPTGGTGRRVMLGIIPDYGTDDAKAGVLISGTTPNTPAAAAGLQPGDVLLAWDGQKLESLMDLSDRLSRAKPGQKVKLQLQRGKQTLDVDVTLAERKD